MNSYVEVEYMANITQYNQCVFPINSSLLPRPTLWSRSEREKQLSYTNAYIWNLEDGADEPVYRAAM